MVNSDFNRPIFKTTDEIRDAKKEWEKKQAPYKRFKRPAYQYTSLEVGGTKNENQDH